MPTNNRKLNIIGVCVDDLDKNEVIDFILHKVGENRKAVISYANVHAINLAQKNAWFRDFLNKCELVFCDGFGVKIAVKVLYGQEIERFTPPDWLPELFKGCLQKGFSVYLIGGKPGIAEKAAAKASELVPGFRPSGADHGYHNKTKTSLENLQTLKMINQARPDILIVGFGMPLQERWIQENKDHLDTKVVIAVGAALDYLAGETFRAPRWMTDNGLEWLGRLIVEPGRLWKRYILGNPVFFWRILLQKLGLIHP